MRMQQKERNPSLSVASTPNSVLPQLVLEFFNRMSVLRDTLINNDILYLESFPDDSLLASYMLGIDPESPDTSVATIYPIYSSATSFQDFVSTWILIPLDLPALLFYLHLLVLIPIKY